MLSRLISALRGWRPEIVRDTTRLYGPVALFGSLALLRLQLVRDVGVGAAEAVEAGVLNGLVQDMFAVLLPVVLAALVWGVSGVARRWIWSAGALAVWIVTLANVLHFRFFGIPLDWWIVTMHWSDLFMVGGSAADLGVAWPIGVSLALLVVAVALGLAQPLLALRRGTTLPAPADVRARRRAGALLLLGSVAAAALFWRLPAGSRCRGACGR